MQIQKLIEDAIGEDEKKPSIYDDSMYPIYVDAQNELKADLRAKAPEIEKALIEILRKEQDTWANQSIGWKAVESVINRLTNNL